MALKKARIVTKRVPSGEGDLMGRRFDISRALNHYIDLWPKMVRMCLIVAVAAASGMIR